MTYIRDFTVYVLSLIASLLTHWGQVTHIYISKLTIIASDNGLSPGQRQAIICTKAGILLIGLLGTNFSEIKIHTLSFKKTHLEMSSAKWRPFCLSLNVAQMLSNCVETLHSFTSHGTFKMKTHWCTQHGYHNLGTTYRGNSLRLGVCRLGHHWFR